MLKIVSEKGSLGFFGLITSFQKCMMLSTDGQRRLVLV